jgi:putative ABC transport system ATP-binding protein
MRRSPLSALAARTARGRPLVSRTPPPPADDLAGPDTGPDTGPAPHAVRPAGATRPVIDVREVSKTYRLGEIRVRALRGITLRIERGDFVAIMGSSGSGKSTLMNIVGCLDVPTTGRYLIDGMDAGRLDGDELADLRNRKIGFVFQSFNLVPRTSAVANVELPLAYAHLDRAERRARAERALRSVGMSHRLRHLPSELSGGQQQRVAVARSIVTNPALILADEPTGNLDSHSTEDVLAIFAGLNVEGRTVVLITHEPDVAAQAKRVVRLSDGAIVADERTRGVQEPPPVARSQKSAHAGGVAGSGR